MRNALISTMTLVLGAALPIAASSDDSRSQASENYTVEHFLRLEGIARVTFSPSGQHLITERSRPLTEIEDASLMLIGLTDRERLHFNLNRAGAATELPVDANISRFASFSPDERKAAVWWVEERTWRAGIYDLERGTVKALDLVPSMDEARNSLPIWISNEELLYAVTTPLNQLRQVAENRAAIETIMRLAQQTWTGTDPSVTVVKSGSETYERPKWLEESTATRLVRVNAITGKVTDLLGDMREWQTQPPMLSYDKRYAAVVRRAEVLSNEHRVPGFREDNRSEMVIIDLRTNAVKKVIAPANAYVEHEFRWAPRSSKILYTTYGLEYGKKVVRFHIFDVERDRSSEIRLPTGFEWWSEPQPYTEPLAAAWDGDGLLVLARKKGAERFDWHTLDGSKARNLTAQLPGEVKTYPVLYGNDLYFTIAGDLWRVRRDGTAANLTTDIDDELRLSCTTSSTRPRPRCNHLAAFDGYAALPVDEMDVKHGVLAFETLRNMTTTGVVFIDLKSGNKERVAAPEGTQRLLATSTANREAIFYSVGADGDRLMAASTSGSREVWMFNAHLANVAAFKTILRDRVTTTSKQGPSVKLRDLLMLPSSYRPGERLPLVVQFYPDTPRYGDDWFGIENPRSMSDLSVSMFVGHGYAVLNAGVAISRYASVGDPMEEIGQQVVEAVQWVIDEGYADPDRMAVIGGSYGGYGVASVLATTDRFKAGIALKGLYNLVGMWGSQYNVERVFMTNGVLGMTAMKGDHDQLRMGGAPWEAMERYIRNSPMLQAHRINAPLLLVHGTNDFDAREAEQMFAALARQGKTVEFARYWGEGHGVGGVANIRDHYRRMLRFLDEHLRAQERTP